MLTRWLSRSTSTLPPPAWQSGQPLIQLRHIFKTYHTPAGDFPALKEVNLEVEAGQFVAVIGKSGSGKSTLINTITGIDRPSSGEIYVAGTPIHTLTENEMALWRGRYMGVIFQFFQLLPTLTLVENVVLPMEFARLYSPGERKERALHLLSLMDMADHARKLPSAVSGGQQQRVAIARALANDPLILVADEPTGSLDSKTADAIFQLFEDLIDQGKTILMVTHDQDLASRVSRAILLADGEVIDEQISTAFSLLDESELVRISTRLEPATFAPGEIIFRQGDLADKFYIIVKGAVEVLYRQPDGREIAPFVLHKGQYFGEIGLLHDAPRSATVRVTGAEKVILVTLDRETFRNLVEKNRLTHDAIARIMRRRIVTEQLLSALPGLNEAQLAQVEAKAQVQSYVPGAIILEENDPPTHFYLVTKGAVELIARDGAQKKVAARLTAGRYFGAFGLHKQELPQAVVRAAPDVSGHIEVVVVDYQVFHQLAVEAGLNDQELSRMLSRQLMNRSESSTNVNPSA